MMTLFFRIIGKICHVFGAFAGRILPKKGVVYMFHEISDSDGEFCVSSAVLESFLASLDKEKVIHLEDWESKTNFIAISIDDVPENFYHNGFPLFRKYGIPFTIFVATSLLDTDGYITTEQLKEMAASPLCTVGSHGVNHSFFRSLNKDERHDELADSKRTLEKIIGKPVELYAFPYGSYYACGYRNKKQVLDYYKYGFGTVNAHITHPRFLKKYFLPRINVNSALIDKLTSSK